MPKKITGYCTWCSRKRILQKIEGTQYTICKSCALQGAKKIKKALDRKEKKCWNGNKFNG